MKITYLKTAAATDFLAFGGGGESPKCGPWNILPKKLSHHI
jgi:hypothetical protein